MNGFMMWVMALAVAAVLAIGITRVGEAAIDDARASTAADAAALAGAAAGHDAAAEAARRNGGVLTLVNTVNDVTTVVVAVGDASATAHAELILIPID